MYLFFSTFITGFDRIIGEEIVKTLKNVKIELLVDGLVIYETSSTPEEIKKVKFFNNSFVLLKKFDDVSSNSANTLLEKSFDDNRINDIVCRYFSNKNYKFRIRASVKNQFVAINKNLLAQIEKKIQEICPKLKVDRTSPEIEFFLLIRSEGFGLSGIRFTKRPNYEKTLAKGELYPELAYILCLLSEPGKDDVFFDPFAGHGSIPAQRLNFPHKEIIAGEIDGVLQKNLTRRFGQKVRVESLNALNLSKLSENSIDKIATDPPWGLYDSNKDIQKLYLQALKEFGRVLKPHGILVILTSQKDLLENLLSQLKDKFRVISRYSTLVSGKKAGVYKIEKTAG